ncbi:MAG: AraC family transcriptional regulator [Myxococcota bacterium]
MTDHRSHLAPYESLAVRRVDDLEPQPAGTRPVVHPHATLAFFERGTATVWCGVRHRVAAGDVLTIPEGHPHHVESFHDVRAWTLSFCASCADHDPLLALLRLCQPGVPRARTMDSAARQEMTRHLDALQSELDDDHPYREFSIEGRLALVACLVLRAEPTLAREPAGSTLCARALAVITERATEGISLDDVARAVHRSAAHIAVVVKRETGRTVVDWITQSRMAAARQLLLSTDENVDGVAARVAFSSPSHFHRVFKRVHGLTPAAWRKEHTCQRRHSPPLGAFGRHSLETGE